MKRILLIQLRQLGDILLTTPAIKAVKAAYPDSTLAFLTHPMGRMVLEGNPLLDELLVYDPKSFINEIKMVKRIRSRKFDLVVDFMNNPRSAFYTLLSKGQVTCGFDSRRRFAYKKLVPRYTSPDYIVREKFTLLSAVGIDGVDESLTLPWAVSDLAGVRAMVKHSGWKNSKMRVILAPTHRRERRRWPMACFAQLADKLVQEWQASVLWIWGPGEEQYIDSVMELCKQPSIKAPATRFREMAALMAYSDLFVGNSNGPSHVAVSVDLPSLQLHGHTLARAWCPLNDHHQAIQAEGQARSGASEMENISLKAVWSKLADMEIYLRKRAAQLLENGDRMP
tara:strand:+ start:465 stop:1481 length:1017 start_codon:yes stop_codon:yes gene_type:complete